MYVSVNRGDMRALATCPVRLATDLFLGMGSSIGIELVFSSSFLLAEFRGHFGQAIGNLRCGCLL